MCVKRKLRRQFGTSRGLFQTYLSEFRWRNFHRNDHKFNALNVLHRWLIWCITWYNYIIFCPTDCVTILFHVFCQYTTFKIALIIYAAIVVVYKVSNVRRYSIGLPIVYTDTSKKNLIGLYHCRQRAPVENFPSASSTSHSGMIDIQATTKSKYYDRIISWIQKMSLSVDYFCLFLPIYYCSYLHRLLRYG
jgi:hypothetical protein